MPRSPNPADEPEGHAEARRRIAEWQQAGKAGVMLRLNGLGLRTLPPELGQLTALKRLFLDGNQLTTLPELGQLTTLEALSLGGNQLTTLPPELGQLTALTWLYLSDNQLTTLPLELGQLTALRALYLRGNPLPAELQALADKASGGQALLAYLRETAAAGAGARKFDEAKLLLVGPGEVGKTWLLQALQGMVPRDVGSTKGLEIAREPLELPHPAEPGRTLHLNCWDFGGQEHYQVTHQIFFSAKAVYLLVWKPRTGLDADLVARLERIELSAGRTARVLIVSTHAEGGVAAVLGQAALRERFGELIWGFYATDSARGPAGTGIAELQRAIAAAAAQMEGMEVAFPPAWHAAREAVLAKKVKTMELGEFAQVGTGAGLVAGAVTGLAAVMEVQGRAVFFAKAAADPAAGLDGGNLVVLDPEWLAKAVGFVIEDGPTIAAQGILKHARLRTIWQEDAARGCPGYEPKLHGYFLWLMWEFDLAYRQDEHTSLIPQHIARNRPDDLLWTPAIAAAGRQVELVCRMPHDPPVGLIPALTAAVQALRRVRQPGEDKLDRNWREGFFLNTEERGAAYVELPDRELRLVVRHGYPANLLGMVLRTLEGIVQQRWPRLELDQRVPCLGRKQGKPCRGTHRKTWLEARRGRTIDCETCGQEDVEVDKMLDGFDAHDEEVLRRLAEVGENQRELLAAAHAMLTAVDPENKERERAPGMFTILPDAGKWSTGATHDAVRVTCWCEHPDGPHPAAPIGSGEAPDYVLTMPKAWVQQAAPYISWAAVLMKAFAPLAGDVAGALGAAGGMDLKEAITLMKDSIAALPAGKLEEGGRTDLEGTLRWRPEHAALRHIHDTLLEKIEPARRWGDLRAVRTKSGQVLWLCARHAAVQQPPEQKV